MKFSGGEKRRPGRCQSIGRSARLAFAGRSTIAVALAILASGCFSNGSRSSPTISQSSPNPAALVVPGQITQIQIVGTPTLATLGGGQNIELYGKDGQLGQYCTPKESLFGSAGPACYCHYYFASRGADGTLDHVPNESPVTYYEDNLVRCDYGQTLPSDAQDIQVQVRSGSTYSNSLPLDLSAALTGTSPRDPGAFIEVKRYQCREIVEIFSLFGGEMIDPFQSESPFNSFPRNFYGTNFGNVHVALTRSAESNFWDCITDTKINPDWAPWMDLRLFSTTPGEGGPAAQGLAAGSLISDGSGSPSRKQTFYVSKRNMGVFNTPVNAVIAPRVTSSEDRDSAGNPYYPPLGYAALPDENGVCPTAAVDVEGNPVGPTLPPNWRWMKLWLLGAKIEQRVMVSAERKPPNLSQVNQVYCDTDQTQATDDTKLFPRLVVSSTLGGKPPMACFRNFPGAGPIHGGPAGSDWWNQSTDTGGNTAKCNQTYAPLKAKEASLSGYWPMDPAPNPEVQDENYISLYDKNDPLPDLLYVITPEIVENQRVDLTMLANALSSRGSNPGLSPYLPYRYLRKADCKPEVAGSTCLAERRLYYSIVELPTTLQNVPYPLCVPQPGGLQ